jgi:hypothetical protein
MTQQSYIAEGAFDITPSDSAGLLDADGKKVSAYGFRVNVGGAVHFVDGLGNEHIWTYDDGGREPMVVTKVYSSGTTAQGIAGYLPRKTL